MSFAKAARTNSSDSVVMSDAFEQTASTVANRSACVGSSSVASLDRADIALATSGKAREMIPTVSRNLHERAEPYRNTRSKPIFACVLQLRVAFR